MRDQYIVLSYDIATTIGSHQHYISHQKVQMVANDDIRIN